MFSEEHILDDVNKCIASLNDNDSDALDRTAGAIRGRCSRVCNVVTAEMENYQAGVYTDKVMDSVCMLKEQGDSFIISLCISVITDLLSPLISEVVSSIRVEI